MLPFLTKISWTWTVIALYTAGSVEKSVSVNFSHWKLNFAIDPDNSNCFSFPFRFRVTRVLLYLSPAFFSLSLSLSSPLPPSEKPFLVSKFETCGVWGLYRFAKFDWRTCWRKLSKLTNYRVYQKPVYRKEVWNNSYRLHFSVYPQAPAIISLFRALPFDWFITHTTPTISFHRIRSKRGCDSQSKWCNRQLTTRKESTGGWRSKAVRTFYLTAKNVGYVWSVTKVRLKKLLISFLFIHLFIFIPLILPIFEK